MDALRVEEVRVLPGRMILRVAVASESQRMTDKRLADLALRLHPTIVEHACINDRGPKFGSVISDTSVAHLLEHLIIAEQLEEMSHDGSLPSIASRKPLVGTTEQVDDLAYKVEVSFIDDLIAARALQRALGFLSRSIRSDLS